MSICNVYTERNKMPYPAEKCGSCGGVLRRLYTRDKGKWNYFGYVCENPKCSRYGGIVKRPPHMRLTTDPSKIKIGFESHVDKIKILRARGLLVSPCPKCNGSHIVRVGTYTTKAGVVRRRLRCCDCGASYNDL